MAIPWLIGGVIAVVATAVTAAVASESSSESSDSGVREKERELERARERKETGTKKEDLRKYANRISTNLAQKYRPSYPKVLTEKLKPLVGSSKNTPKTKEFDSSLLELTDEYSAKKHAVEKLELELVELEDAMALLEMMDDEFK
jgi:gas vesicle protein